MDGVLQIDTVGGHAPNNPNQPYGWTTQWQSAVCANLTDAPDTLYTVYGDNYVKIHETGPGPENSNAGPSIIVDNADAPSN